MHRANFETVRILQDKDLEGQTIMLNPYISMLTLWDLGCCSKAVWPWILRIRINQIIQFPLLRVWVFEAGTITDNEPHLPCNKAAPILDNENFIGFERVFVAEGSPSAWSGSLEGPFAFEEDLDRTICDRSTKAETSAM